MRFTGDIQIPRGYGQSTSTAPEPVRVASPEKTRSIWYTVRVFDDPLVAAEFAMDYADEFVTQGHTVTGVGFTAASAEAATFRGYVTFADAGPQGAVAVGSKKTAWWCYGLAAGGGALVGALVGAYVGSNK